MRSATVCRAGGAAPAVARPQQQQQQQQRRQQQQQQRAVASAHPAPGGRPQVQQSLGRALVAVGAASLLLLGGAPGAMAARGRTPPVTESEGRCEIGALDKFAETRAQFSQEASGGNMTEANVDVRGCDFSSLDLRSKVLSGVSMQGADFSGTNLAGIQFARAAAQGASLRGADLTDVNAYSTQFDGADLEGAQFENAILSSASFGKYEGEWANLKGAHFEGALLSSSDVVRICENPTLDDFTKKAELGCRKTR